MTDVIIEVGLYGITVPAVVAGLLWLVVSGVPGEGGRRPWGGAFAVAVGYLVGHNALSWRGDDLVASLLGMVGEPKTAGLVAGVALAVGLLDSLVDRRRPLVAAVVFAGAVGLVMYIVVGDLFGDPWTIPGTAARIGIVTVGFAAMRWTLEDRIRAHPGATGPLVLTLLGTGAALILALRGTVRLAEQIGILTATAGAAIPVAWWRASFSPARGGVTAFLLVLAGLFSYGYFLMYGPPVYAALLLVVAPHALWIAEIGPLGDLSGWKQTLSRVMCVAVAVGAAVAVAWMGTSSF